MIWTLISAVMSSLLYQLSYNLDSLLIKNMRTKDLHPYILDMSQLCYYYINPQLIIIYKNIIFIYNNINQLLYMLNIASEGIEPSYVMMKTLCLNHLTIRPYYIWCIYTCNVFKPSASIALTSAGYKTATLLLC